MSPKKDLKTHCPALPAEAAVKRQVVENKMAVRVGFGPTTPIETSALMRSAWPMEGTKTMETEDFGTPSAHASVTQFVRD